MLDAIRNIQRMEADIIAKYAESNAWLDELDASWLDDDDLPLEFQDEGVTLEHDDPTDYDIAIGDAGVVCPHTYAPTMSDAATMYAQQVADISGARRDEDAAHAALLAALGL